MSRFCYSVNFIVLTNLFINSSLNPIVLFPSFNFSPLENNQPRVDNLYEGNIVCCLNKLIYSGSLNPIGLFSPSLNFSPVQSRERYKTQQLNFLSSFGLVSSLCQNFMSRLCQLFFSYQINSQDWQLFCFFLFFLIERERFPFR